MNKEPMNIALDWHGPQWLALSGIILMTGVAAWNLFKKDPSIAWAIADVIIGLINVWTLFFGLYTNRDIRVANNPWREKK